MARSRTPPELARSRARLLRAATDLFAKQGYKATNVDQIVAAAGYTRGALYWHFHSKEDLFLEVYDAAMAEAARNILSRVAGSANCRERIRRAIIAVLEEAALHQQSRALHYAYLQEFGKPSGRRPDALSEQFRIFESEMAKIIAAGIKRGEFPKQDPDLAAMQVVSTVQGVADAVITTPTRFDNGTVADATADFCLRALLHAPGPRVPGAA